MVVEAEGRLLAGWGRGAAASIFAKKGKKDAAGGGGVRKM